MFNYIDGADYWFALEGITYFGKYKAASDSFVVRGNIAFPAAVCRSVEKV